ncbi:MAG: hypothetical protein U0V74_00470 [Chitinophagales bacterium]
MRFSEADLHKLVRGFTANEKMLFKRFNANAKSQAAYIVLFDLLASMKDYDKQRLKAELKRLKITVHLPSLKSYLYDQLILFLRVHKGSPTPAWKMRQMNIDADLLFERGFHKNALQLYEEQLEEANNHSNPQIQLVALDNMIKYAQRTGNPFLLETYESKLLEALSLFSNRMEIQIQFRTLVRFYSEKFPIRDKSALAELKQLGKKMPFKTEEEVYTPAARIFFYNYYYYYNYMLGNFERSYEFAIRRLECVKSYEKELQPVYSYQLSTFELLINSSLHLKKPELALKHFLNLEQICKGKTDVRTKLLLNFAFAAINAVHNWPEATTERRMKTKDFLVSQKETTPVVSLGLMDLAYSCFRNREYNETLSVLDEILSDKSSFQHTIVQTQARLLGILTHYELKNYLLIEYLIANTKRYLRQHARLRPFERTVLNGVKHLPEKINEQDMRAYLYNLKNNLQKLSKNPFERNLTRGFNFVSWIENKLQ